MRFNLIDKIKPCCGVYIIKFPNGKFYIGSSKDIKRRIHEHIYGIYYDQEYQWYRTAAIENNFIAQENITWKQRRSLYEKCPVKVYVHKCSNYKEKEKEVLKSISKEDRVYCYNTQFESRT